MITREQVADLIGGDVVELHRQGWADDVVVRGTLRGDSCAGELYIGDYSIFSENGNEPDWLAFPGTTLTVVSRAPRPLYVNHPRTEPVPKDVVLAPDGNGELVPWICIQTMSGTAPPHFVRPTEHGMSHALPKGDAHSRMCQPWRLLVDGETGQVVQ